MLNRLNKINLDEIRVSPKKIVIYGAGEYGRKVYGFLNQMDISVYAFCDTHKKGNVGNLAILSPKMLLQEETYLFILAIYSDSFKREVMDLLDKKNLQGDIFAGDICIDSNIAYFYDRQQKCFILNNRYQFYREVPWYFHLAYDRYPSKEYIKGVFIGYPQIYLKNNYYCGADFQSKYVNILDGKRVTTDVPGDYKNKVIFFGDSRINGYGLEDNQTIPSCLQRMLNQRWPERYCCENYSFGAYSFSVVYNLIKDILISKDDIILCQLTSIRGYDTNFAPPNGTLQWYLQKITDYCKAKGAIIVFLFLGQNQPVNYVNNKSMAEEYICKLFGNNTGERRYIDKFYRRFEDMEYWEEYCLRAGASFVNCIEALRHLGAHPDISYFLDEVHPGTFGAQLIAEDLFCALIEQNIIREIGNKSDFATIHEALAKNDLVFMYPFCEEDSFREYLDYLKVMADDSLFDCGAIVMNANPFTKGHRYLVESASKQVDRLYIFVLEEDRSDFPFHDRIDMVREGVKDLSNVVVLKSGSFIISERTFPEYFSGKDLSNPDCSKDLGIFGYFIAPVLHITKRFVGTEPYSVVTKAYNEQMKSIFPLYNIELVEIERMTVGQEIVSATKVRRALEDKDYTFLKSLLPDSSYNFLMQHGYLC